MWAKESVKSSRRRYAQMFSAGSIFAAAVAEMSLHQSQVRAQHDCRIFMFACRLSGITITITTSTCGTRTRRGPGRIIMSRAMAAMALPPVGTTSPRLTILIAKRFPKPILRQSKVAPRTAQKAGDQLQASCPTAVPKSPVARIDTVETRLRAMTDAIKSVRPDLQNFYASLSDEQKAKFNTMGPPPKSGSSPSEN